MKAKVLKKYLKLYDDAAEVVVKGVSGIDYEIREDKVSEQTLIDQKRKVCKLHIK